MYEVKGVGGLSHNLSSGLEKLPDMKGRYCVDIAVASGTTGLLTDRIAGLSRFAAQVRDGIHDIQLTDDDIKMVPFLDKTDSQRSKVNFK